jgi:hypothetical protein
LQRGVLQQQIGLKILTLAKLHQVKMIYLIVLLSKIGKDRTKKTRRKHVNFRIVAVVKKPSARKDCSKV